MPIDILPHLDFFIKCSLSLLLGCLIGFERETKKKPAGIKTHALICLGSTILSYLSIHVSPYGDPARITAQIVSGIGFIGAGTIFQAKERIRGLTSAANIWVTAAIGMLIGSGFLILSIIGTVLIVMLFLLFRPNSINTTHPYAMTIELKHWDGIKDISEMLQNFDIEVYHKVIDRSEYINLKIGYTTNELTQHLFSKRLFQLKSVGKILQI